jgi:hypothetical protein
MQRNTSSRVMVVTGAAARTIATSRVDVRHRPEDAPGHRARERTSAYQAALRLGTPKVREPGPLRPLGHLQVDHDQHPLKDGRCWRKVSTTGTETL